MITILETVYRKYHDVLFYTLLSVFLALFCLPSVSAQKADSILNKYLSSFHTESAFVTLDRPMYVPGDTIYGNIHWVDGRSQQAFDTTTIVYLDWINPDDSIVQTKFVKMENGQGPFSIATAIDIPAGSYSLRAYTMYQLNFKEAIFQREVLLLTDPYFQDKWALKDTLVAAISVYPEGGYVVKDLDNSLVIHVTGRHKEHYQSGVILDDQDNIITRFKTITNGLARVDYKPTRGRQYRIKMMSPTDTLEQDLPNGSDQGSIISINQNHPDLIRVILKSNQLDAAKYLLVHHRGEKILGQEVVLPKSGIKVPLDRKNLPSGILNFVLFDANQNVLSERIAYNVNPTTEIEGQIEVTGIVGTSQPTTLQVKLSDSTVSNASITIYHDDLTDFDIQDVNLTAHSLLHQDLERYRPDLEVYMDQKSTKNRIILDAYLSATIQSKYTWSKILEAIQKSLVFPAQNGFSIGGQVTKNGKDKGVAADISLSILSDNDMLQSQMTTDEEGTFLFTGLQIPKPSNIILDARRSNAKKNKNKKEGDLRLLGRNNVHIKLIDIYKTPFDKERTIIPPKVKKNLTFADVQKRKSTNKKFVKEIFERPNWSIDLEGITVEAKQYTASYRQKETARRYKKKGLWYWSSTDKFLVDDPNNKSLKKDNIFHMLRRLVPGTSVRVVNGKMAIIYGFYKIPIALDGLLVDDDFIHAIDPRSIYSAELLFGTKAIAQYGKATVLALLSREPLEYVPQRPNKLNFVHQGYHTASNRNNNPPTGGKDIRRLLYWSPNIKMKKGRAEITFNTSSLIGKHTVKIEGYTKDGRSFSIKKSILVEE